MTQKKNYIISIITSLTYTYLSIKFPWAILHISQPQVPFQFQIVLP